MKLFRKKKRKAKRPLDLRLRKISEAAARLLAEKDYDAISMAEVARQAGCSVGALYARFPDKYALLYYVIAAILHVSADDGAGQEAGKDASMESEVRGFIHTAIAELIRPRVAGAIRAAVKLGLTHPEIMELLERYRKNLTDRAIKSLPDTQKIPAAAMRAGMQVVLATVIDAILQKRPGPMAADGAQIRSTLSDMLISHLERSRTRDGGAFRFNQKPRKGLDHAPPSNKAKHKLKTHGHFRPGRSRDLD